MENEQNEDQYWRQNLHPQSVLQTESQVTIQDLKSSYIGEGSDLQQALKKYSLEQRIHLIINRTTGQIIDTRNEEVVEGMFKKQTNKMLDMQDFEESQIPMSKTTITSNPWEEHWEASEKAHQKLLAAICNQDRATFQKLINNKDNRLPININYKSFDNWSPIHYASMHGNLSILKLILQQNDLKINAKTNFGWNSLHVAVNSDKRQVCKLLIQAGIALNQEDQDLCTPLHYATELANKDIIKLLLKAGADYKIVNHKGYTSRQLCNSKQLLDLFPKEKGTEDQKEQGFFQSFLKNRKIQYVEKLLTGSNPTAIMSSPDKKQISAPKNLPSTEEKSGSSSPKKINRKNNIVRMYQLLKQNKQEQPVTLSSFKFFKKIGEGAFGQVYVVRKGNKDKLYALKAIKKDKVLKTNLYRYIQTQKEVLSLISHPFIVKLNYAFQTQTYLFLVMDYCEGGDLGKLLQKKKKLEESTTKAYACQIVLALEALHKNMIIYRDLKPQNVVLDSDGHALLTDFGLSKKTTDLDAINKSFCGTPAYLPLQIIEKRGHTRMADWYEFGVVLYEMLVGIPPFYADNRLQLYQNVKNGIIKFPKSAPQKFRDLIKGLLHQDYHKRLGFENDAESIKRHPWFEDIDWTAVYERRLVVPPLEKKHNIGSEPIRCKYQDTKSQKYQIPSWSFIKPS